MNTQSNHAAGLEHLQQNDCYALGLIIAQVCLRHGYHANAGSDALINAIGEGYSPQLKGAVAALLHKLPPSKYIDDVLACSRRRTLDSLTAQHEYFLRTRMIPHLP
jgi:hypothetical protein